MAIDFSSCKLVGMSGCPVLVAVTIGVVFGMLATVMLHHSLVSCHD